MADPRIAERFPAVLELEPGTYKWCACGDSQNQPFCDGSHRGTEFSPRVVELTEKKRVALCQCKHSGNKPYCDGTHASLGGDGAS
ncbi:CDGSH iron-sulfur domain-containing protein [bacterium]|nr:CDGSH iron-sulfur domain-containing protein [bacterium]